MHGQGDGGGGGVTARGDTIILDGSTFAVRAVRDDVDRARQSSARRHALRKSLHPSSFPYLAAAGEPKPGQTYQRYSPRRSR